MNSDTLYAPDTTRSAEHPFETFDEPFDWSSGQDQVEPIRSEEEPSMVPRRGQIVS